MRSFEKSMLQLNSLYPKIEPFNTFFLETESIHQVYVEEVGNPGGLPVIFLHGGPGSGCNPDHRRYFDPDKYRIVIFDQRGCNRSTPQGDVRNNSTDFLLQDMENIRKQLDIKRWILFGGSWGATLSLLYAERYPQHVMGLILRGAFLARKRDLEWFIKDGVNRLLPDAWRDLNQVVPDSERHNLISSFHAMLRSKDHAVKLSAARHWSRWCTRIVTWNFMQSDERGDQTPPSDEANRRVINEVTIETHYALNHYFIRENQILDNIDKLPDVPVKIIHGRQDITCLPESSWQLHQLIQKSNLE
ncbi:MAG: prolyl aminopeptidase, partial [Proteobacteria bacterium]|nr:prolyl aminopeptidase [Pseudomonadota bacterium]